MVGELERLLIIQQASHLTNQRAGSEISFENILMRFLNLQKNRIDRGAKATEVPACTELFPKEVQPAY